jgi:hypothetical protein
MALAYFTVTGKYESFAGQLVAGAPVAPTPLSGTIIFTPVIMNGGTVKTADARLALQLVQAILDKDGYVSTATAGGVGCKLVANVGLLNIDSGELHYTATFKDMRGQDGAAVEIRPFSFVAPKVDGAVVDLVSVSPVALTPSAVQAAPSAAASATTTTAASVKTGSVDGGSP